MASMPPVYTNDSPPSYEEVVKRLDGLIGNNRTATGVFGAAQNLTQVELDVLADKFDPRLLKTNQEKVDFTKGATQTSCASNVSGLLQEAANGASTTAAEIKSQFHDLQSKLKQVDIRFGTSWERELIQLNLTFQSVLDDSHSMSSRTNSHARLFDVDVSYAANQSQSLNSRKVKINAAIKRAEPLEQEAKSFETRINSLTDTFSQFISRFVSWTRDKEGQLTEELIRLKEDLIRLERKLADLQNAYEAVSHVSQGITPIIGALSATFPPYSTVIAIGGLIFAGVSLAATTGLLVGIGTAKRDIAAKIKEKARLEEDIEFVRSAREGLEQTGTESVADFKSALVSMPALAAASRIDASEIKAWLDNGAPESGRPFYLVENSVNNVKSYSSMGEYFQTYARGIQALCTPGIVEKE